MIVDVTDHGADPTGQTDSRPAWTSALAALRAAGGGTLQIPPGDYVWASWESRARHIHIDFPVVWDGPGMNGVRIRVTAYDNDSQRAITITDTHDVTLRGLEIDYSRPMPPKKQAAAVWSQRTDGLRIEGCRIIAGGGDAVYAGSDVQALEVVDLEADAARGIVTAAGDSVGRYRSGYRISGLRRIDRGAVPAGARYSAINFERSDSSNDTYWGVEIDDVHAPDGSVGVKSCIGARLRDVTCEQLWYHGGRVVAVDCHVLGRVGGYGDGEGATYGANGPGELVVMGGSARVPEGGACLVYQRILGDGPRSVVGYGVDVDIAEGATLHHPTQWAGSRWYDLAEVTP